MKKWMLVPVLGMALLLSGCAAMLERSHVSSTAHVDYAVEEDESILRAETYQGLVNSMLYFIDGHRSSGVIRLYNYAGDVDTDLAAARDEALQDPVGAFAVGTLSYDSTRILSYYEVKLSITYSHTLREVEAIPEVTGLSGVRQELSRLVNERQKSAVFLASYFSGDRETVETLLIEGVYNAPALFCYPAGPQADLDYTIILYPETGTRRMVEVKVNWRDTEQESAQRVEELERVASALLEANPPESEDGYTVEELAAIVRSAHGGQDAQGTSLIQDVLSGEPASDPGLLMAMEYLCHQCGIEALTAWGEGMRQGWLIVSTQSGFRHLLPDSLYAPAEDPDGEEPEPDFRLYTDMELAELGYEWDLALYPACLDETAQALSEDGQETAPK